MFILVEWDEGMKGEKKIIPFNFRLFYIVLIKKKCGYLILLSWGFKK